MLFEGMEMTKASYNTTLSDLGGWVTKLNSGDWYDRAEAAKALASAGPFAVSDLINALASKQREVRYAAAWALGEIGSDIAVGALCNALRDKDWTVREVSALALGRIGDQRARTSLDMAVKDEVRSVRCAAARALGYLNDRV